LNGGKTLVSSGDTFTNSAKAITTKLLDQALPVKVGKSLGYKFNRSGNDISLGALRTISKKESITSVSIQ
jgi:hypothetical protein